MVDVCIPYDVALKLVVLGSFYLGFQFARILIMIERKIMEKKRGKENAS